MPVVGNCSKTSFTRVATSKGTFFKFAVVNVFVRNEKIKQCQPPSFIFTILWLFLCSEKFTHAYESQADKS